MHPSLVRAFVEANVEDLRTRLGGRPDLKTGELTLDLDSLTLNVPFDHTEHDTEVVDATSPFVLPGGRRIARQQRVPILGRSRVRHLTLHMALDGFDLVPPTADLLGEDGEPLAAGEWPTSFAGGGIVQDHPIYGRPFFCRRGLREFHEHEQHEDDPWVRWRDALPLHAIVVELLGDLRVRWHGAA